MISVVDTYDESLGLFGLPEIVEEIISSNAANILSPTLQVFFCNPHLQSQMEMQGGIFETTWHG
jgi:hypothetical protein